jgi:membrane protein DedA with SNARE-associated domain
VPQDLLIYLTAFIGPFVQEDAAIIGAVTAFLHPETHMMASGPLILSAMFLGLVISDLWKYWIGAAGRSQNWAKAMVNKPSVGLIASKIQAHPGKTLLLARFIPGTRIPAYIAAGFFGVSFPRFAVWIVVSGLAYVVCAGILLATVGAVAGKNGQVIVAATLIGLMLSWVCLKLVQNSLKGRASSRASTPS